MGILGSLFSDKRELATYGKLADTVLKKVEHYKNIGFQNVICSDMTEALKKKLNSCSENEAIIDAFTAVCVASGQALGIVPYKVQIIGAIAMYFGAIAEMKTGEGKTLAAAMPAYLNALKYDNVHIVTVNEYLAGRDAENIGKVFNALGLTVSNIYSEMSDEDRKKAYACNIVYGTSSEFGFDYLRDNMAVSEDCVVQRGLNCAIIDEADNILIDEARTPLIISGQSDLSNDDYIKADKLVKTFTGDFKSSITADELVENTDADFIVDEKHKSVVLTAKGYEKLYKEFGLSDESKSDLLANSLHTVVQAIRANYMLKPDVDYVVHDGEIKIIDEFTGRILEGRRYNNGLQQAVEAKEGIVIKKETITLAEITIQNFFRLYNKLSGMTGTAKTEEAELESIYGLRVLQIPTNKPMIRVDYPDQVYLTKKAKLLAIMAKVVECREICQPVLIGTTSVEQSEQISRMLSELGIEHNVLNAKNNKAEAEIIAQAGIPGAVTVATNMAGRGTDILLGGNPDYVGTYNTMDRAKAEKRVINAGGLCVIGTERHESRRIDNQLIGRSGRQGNPGESWFMLSLEDDLIRVFGGDNVKAIASMLGGESVNDPINSRLLSRIISKAQARVESLNFEARKSLLEYDNVVSGYREIIYKQRDAVLHNHDLDEVMLTMAEHYFEDSIDVLELMSSIESNPALSKIFESDHFNPGGEPVGDFVHAFHEMIDDKLSSFDAETKNSIIRSTILSNVDRLWRNYVDDMAELRKSIKMQAYASKNPIDEFRKIADAGYTEMLSDIHRAVTEQLTLVEFNPDGDAEQSLG